MSGGGPTTAKDVMDYKAPQGPRHVMDTGVGLRGGTNYGNAGSQSKRSLSTDTGGTPGQLNSDVHPDGTQR